MRTLRSIWRTMISMCLSLMVDALQAIDLLHFVDEVLLQFLRAADVEDFVRVDRAFGQLLAFLDVSRP